MKNSGNFRSKVSASKFAQGLKANKKILMLILVGCLFAGAVYLNVSLNQNKINIGNVAQTAEDTYSESAIDDTANSSDTAGKDYFETFRTDRDVLREKEIAYLDEIIAASANDDETLKDAQEHKLTLVENMEKEFAIEQLVKAKGFSEAAVTFKSSSVSVVVDKESLTEEDVAKILDVVKSETGLDAKNIKIIPSA